MQYLSKITLKSIDAQPKPRSVTAPEILAHVFGIARRFRVGSSAYGIFHSFLGEFEAVNLSTGEVTRSGRILLPPIAEKILLERMEAGGATAGKDRTATQDEEDGEAASEPIEFAFAIGVRPLYGPDGKTLSERGSGYEYTLHPLMEMRENDSLAKIRDESRKQLAAPNKETEKKKK
jgi:hypothetical protein